MVWWKQHPGVVFFVPVVEKPYVWSSPLMTGFLTMGILGPIDIHGINSRVKNSKWFVSSNWIPECNSRCRFHTIPLSFCWLGKSPGWKFQGFKKKQVYMYQWSIKSLDWGMVILPLIIGIHGKWVYKPKLYYWVDHPLTQGISGPINIQANTS